MFFHMASHKRTLKLVLLLAGAGVLGVWIYLTGPTTQPEVEIRPPRIVNTLALQPTRQRIAVHAFGTVIPARRVIVEPQVSGHIVRLSPKLIPGGHHREGEELYAIDSRLAELSVRETAAEVKRGEADLKEALRKWKEGQRLAAELVIPATELASLESEFRMREAELERLKVRAARSAELLQRHVVRAPFNAVVVQEAMEVGQRVDPGDATATLVGTDEFWVQVSLPTDKVSWVRLPTETQPGASAQVVLDIGGTEPTRYEGKVIQLLSDMEEVGRMARVLIRVEDPLGLRESNNSAPLLLGSYVRVEIDAGELDNVLVIDRPALREGNRIWVVDANNRLQIRNVNVRWRDEKTVTIDADLAPGEQLIVSDLRVALPDMAVQPQQVQDQASDSETGLATPS
jgi:RND family efflux transporter MFP subunit